MLRLDKVYLMYLRSEKVLHFNNVQYVGWLKVVSNITQFARLFQNQRYRSWQKPACKLSLGSPPLLHSALPWLWYASISRRQSILIISGNMIRWISLLCWPRQCQNIGWACPSTHLEWKFPVGSTLHRPTLQWRLAQAAVSTGVWSIPTLRSTRFHPHQHPAFINRLSWVINLNTIQCIQICQINST